MRLHSLRARIAVVFVLLTLLVQLGATLVINKVIDANARHTVQDQLSVAERVFQQIQRVDGEKLTQAASIVASDFGFRQAAATRDELTVASALKNSGDRVGARIVMLVGLDGKIIADSGSHLAAGAAFPFPGLIHDAESQGDGASIGKFGGRAYQLVAVPVKAPVTIAWVAMGFEIDDTFATEMSRLTALDVSFINQHKDGRWSVLATSHASAYGAARSTLLTNADLRWNAEYASRVMTLKSSDGMIAVLLQRSLSDALLPYQRLHTALLLIVLCGVGVTIIGSIVVAGNVTRSVGALTQFSHRIQQGDYHEPLVVTRNDEIGRLSMSFNLMQAGIAERERKITELAYVDTLTGLPNRVRFNDHLLQAIGISQRTGQPLSVLVMDLDRFKYVNDTLGHPVGDMLLREVAARLRHALHRDTDMVARLGGDEFAVMLPTDDIDGAKKVAARILRTLEMPTMIEGQLVDVGASIGIVSYPHDGDDMNVLLRHADIAMYTAKRANAGFALYDEKHDHNSAMRLSLLSELRQAVERDELTLFYQPKVDLSTQRVKCVEALVRWVHPTRGFIPPDEFIPFAEQTGYIKTISRWVANKAIEQCAKWHAQGIELAVSVNVSARELIQSSLPDTFMGLLRKHGVDPQWIWIEVTESAIIDDPNHAIETLDRLHALGIRISIDDFGTGYSSLSYLKRMPVDELKIDKSFVMGMMDHKDDETIVRSTINLGHNMGMKVVAEGVETEAMMAQLRMLDCDLVQGFHISRPLPPEKLEAWMDQWALDQAAIEAAALADAAAHTMVATVISAASSAV